MKRWMDFTIALLGLLILAPFLVLLAICVRWNFGRPIFFSQERPGLGGLPFRIWKFRTMTDDRDEAGNLLPDKQRLTRFGRFLRSTSLDELPELLNVLRGEMSLVGPRPLLMSYLNRYTPEQARRHEVLPGITGWAQIHGRNAISWEEKLDLDLWYVNHQSLWVDIKVLVLTLVAVVKRTGINAADHATMPEFLGTGRERTEERGAA